MHSGTYSNFYKISNSGHHLYFDNPEEFAATIIKDCLTVNEVVDIHKRLEPIAAEVEVIGVEPQSMGLVTST